VPTTAVVNFRMVCLKYAELIKGQGGTLITGTCVERLSERNGVHTIETDHGVYETHFLINCAGLHSDRVARLSGLQLSAKIIPFRGEYYELIPERRHFVKTLIYPVPNPAFPFLGVHFTRMIDGTVRAGPNAVLAFKREGYRKTDFNFRDFVETIQYHGFWKLARKHFKEGMLEIRRSLSKTAFVHSLQRLIPDVQASDLVPTQAGVRAQALRPDGNLVDDFLILKGRNSLHVCNAPSPAATASLEIGKAIAAQVPELQNRTTVAV